MVKMTAEKPKIKTMEDLSSTIGVSRPTLSKYFQDPENVSKTSKLRIEAALETVDYVPNYFATRLNRKSTGVVGVVVPFLADPFFAEIARTVETRCIEAGFSPILFSSHGKMEQENDILDTLRSMNTAGVLLAPLGRSSDRQKVERFCADIPTVLFDSNLEGIGAAFIGSNNFQSVPMMVEYLSRVAEPPCFFEMPPINPNANKRREAYISAMERLGHEPQLVQVEGTGWSFEEIGYEQGKIILSKGGLPSNSVFCSNDRLAIGFLSAAFELGFTVGRGDGDALRVAGHDDHPFSRFTSPSLTTVSQDYQAISKSSVETLLLAIEDRSSVSSTVNLYEGRLVMRASA